MKYILIYLFVCLFFCSCGQPCKDGLELLPMYGKEKKCKKQTELDEQFIKACIEQYGSTKEAGSAMLRFGWKHYVEGDFETAMKRFNQAWLLDSLNAEVFTGFGSILSDEEKYQESLFYLDKSLELNPENSDVWKLSGAGYLKLFHKTNEDDYLKKSIAQLKKSVTVNPANAAAYALLTGAYLYDNQKDSAQKYMKITDELNPGLIRPDLRDMINNK